MSLADFVVSFRGREWADLIQVKMRASLYFGRRPTDRHRDRQIKREVEWD